MKRYITRSGIIAAALIFIMNAVALAAVVAPQIKGIRLGDDLTKTRIVIDLSSIPQYAVREEKNGSQLQLLMFDTISANTVSVPGVKGNAVTKIVKTTDGPSTVITVDLKEKLNYKAFTLANPPRLVLDVNKEYETIKTTAQGVGLNLINYFHSDAKGPVTAYILDIDPKNYTVGQALAGGDIASGRYTVKNTAAVNGAIAAANASYFDWEGWLVGCGRLQGKTTGTFYIPRTGFGIMKDKTMQIATTAYEGYATINGVTLPVSGVNVPRGENNTILYNSLYGKRTGTNEYGMEYTIRNGKVVAMQQGNSIIPYNATVVSVHGTSMEAFANVKLGDSAEVFERMNGKLEDAVEIIGGGPEILRNGMVHVTSNEEEFPSDISSGRAPRTAMGIKADGHVLLAVIDGRQQHSIGATLRETAEILKRFGAVDAMNFDGGGSSELVLKGQVVNKPSDGAERPVANCIIIKEKN